MEGKAFTQEATPQTEVGTGENGSGKLLAPKGLPFGLMLLHVPHHSRIPITRGAAR
jgi:hypothetical protein